MGKMSTWIVVVAASLVLVEGKLLLCTAAPTTIISWKRTKRMRIASSADFDLFHGLEDRPLFLTDTDVERAGSGQSPSKFE